MDGIEKIIGRINAAAAEDCAAIAQKAQQESELIRADYAQKVQSAYESAMKSGERELAQEAERIIRNAKLKNRQELLAAKQALLDKAFESAKQKLKALPEDEYIAWLASMASQATKGSGELILDAKDAPLGETELKLAQTISGFLGRHMES